MKNLRRHPFRTVGRILWFLAVVATALGDYFFRCAFHSKNSARALWLQRHARHALRIFKFSANVSGAIPRNGLLVSNHLSYLDILVLASLAPAIFVSKREVRHWPLIGWLASLGGTLFVDRERRTRVGVTNDEIQNALDAGALVVLFPEGTSSNGETVLPFKTSLLEPVSRDTHPLTAGWLHYEIDDGDARDDVCYWGDHFFFPHLVNLLGKKSVRATVRFKNFEKTTSDRKELARQLHATVLSLKSADGK